MEGGRTWVVMHCQESFKIEEAHQVPEFAAAVCNTINYRYFLLHASKLSGLGSNVINWYIFTLVMVLHRRDYQTHKLSIILLTWFFVILKSSYKLFILISRNLVSRLILHGSITSSLWKGIASFSLYLGSINTSCRPDTSFKWFKFLHTTDLWSLIATLDKNLIS